MKILRTLALCFIAGLSCYPAFADAVAVNELVDGKEVTRVLQPAEYGSGSLDDPRVRVRRLRRGSVPFVGFTFNFQSDSGTGTFDFFNKNPVGLRDLTFIITPGGPSNAIQTLFDCGVDTDLNALPFSSCNYNQFGDSNSATVIHFFGAPGLPAFSHFAIELTGFPAGAAVSATAIPFATPEPGTLMLFLSGMGGLLARRKVRRNLA